MEPTQFFASFRTLHDKARRGSLDQDDRQRYLSMKEEFGRSLMRAQGQSIADHLPARRQLRVAHVYPVEIANLYKTMTRELSCRGFTAVVPGAVAEGDEVSWALTAGRGAEPIAGIARVATSSRTPGGTYRVTCDFENLDEARLDRLEFLVFDAALARVG